MQSEGQMEGDQDIEDEEEPIEEDICDNAESPEINARTKELTGQKARVLF